MGLRDLFRPASQSPDESKRARAVEELEDPALAVTIFRNDASPTVKHVALEKLIALDCRQGESLFSVLLRHDLDASAIAFVNPAKHLVELVGNLGQDRWRAEIIRKLKLNAPDTWPETVIAVLGEHEQSDDPELRAFTQEILRDYQRPVAARSVLLALLSRRTVKAVRESDQFMVSAWAEQREGRTEYCVQHRPSDGWGMGTIRCRSAEEAAGDFVSEVGPKNAMAAAAHAEALAKGVQDATPKTTPVGRVVVGTCESCNRPLRIKDSAISTEMRLTCKCGHVNIVHTFGQCSTCKRLVHVEQAHLRAHHDDLEKCEDLYCPQCFREDDLHGGRLLDGNGSKLRRQRRP